MSKNDAMADQETTSNAAPEDRRGKIITFYSYKGGTGRTMAVANVGVLLSKDSPHNTKVRMDGTPPRVLLIDWDLEAPGLEEFFPPVIASHLGVLDYFEQVSSKLGRMRSATPAAVERRLGEVDLDRFIRQSNYKSLWIMGAGSGRDDEGRAKRVRELDWRGLFERTPALFEGFARALTRRFDFVLIDSRTGASDIGGVCTALLPERLVLVFTPNRQSVQGCVRIGRAAAAHRAQSPDVRPLTIFPLPSRIEASEPDLRDVWRRGDNKTAGYQPMFEELLSETYLLDECDLTDYFDEVQVQHVPRFAYGEDIAVVTERTDDRLSLTRSYQRLTERLQRHSAPWDLRTAVLEPRAVPESIPVDLPVILRARARADELYAMSVRIGRGEDLVEARRLARESRSYIKAAWLPTMQRLNADARPGGIAEDDIYPTCLETIRVFEHDVLGLEEFALSLAETEFQAGLQEIGRVVDSMISLSTRSWSGSNYRAVTGAPGLVGLRLILNIGAKGVDNGSNAIVRWMLNRPIVLEDNQDRLVGLALPQRSRLFFSEGMLGRADLTIRYVVDESWRNEGLHFVFADRGEYLDALSAFLFLVVMKSAKDSTQSWYPGFKLIPGSSEAIRRFIINQTATSDGVARFAEILDEDVAELKDSWAARVKVLNEASLGERYFLADWEPIPGTLSRPSG